MGFYHMYKISLQTITWGDPQHHLFDEIFALANSCGFQGLEIGFRRLSAIGIPELQELLDRNGMIVNASHIGGNLIDVGQAANERAGLKAVLDHLSLLNVPSLIYSGLNEQSDDALNSEIGNLGLIAGQCANMGIDLLYHNHDWEFANGRRIWKRLQEAGIGSLGYALDLGWAAKSGQDLTSILEELGTSVKVLHFKDFKTRDPGDNTCHLGAGIIDFAPVWEWLADRKDQDIWLTAEQDNAEDAGKACAANGDYLKKNLDALG